jgi:hypothetical protein
VPIGRRIVSPERLRWHTGEVTKSAADEEILAQEVSELDEDALIRTLATGRREGRDTSQEVEALLEVTAQENRAALDRLAK